jgi:hypothetical protein
MNFLAISFDSANDAVTALLAILVGSMLRVIWSLQQRISRLEGMDEMRERLLDTSRSDGPPYDQEQDQA